MPFYEYKCNNEECETVINGTPFVIDKMCPMGERNNLPKCEFCGQDMPRFYGSPPSVSWRYLSANGVWKTSSLGPAQRADRRLLKYENGRAIWRPIYKDGKKIGKG